MFTIKKPSVCISKFYSEFFQIAAIAFPTNGVFPFNEFLALDNITGNISISDNYFPVRFEPDGASMSLPVDINIQYICFIIFALKGFW